MRKLLVAIVALSSLFTMVSAPVVAADTETSKKSKRVPALRAKVYSQLARSQSLADEDKIAEALETLDNVNRKSKSMNSYEIAMMHNFYAFIYYGQENYTKAIEHFQKVVDQEAIPESLRQSTIFSLSQLAMMNGNYDKTIEYLHQWMEAAGDDVTAKAYVLMAQAYYQKKDYNAALEPINSAIALVDADPEKKLDENWLVLQRAIYYELKQPVKVTEVLERMVKLFDEPKYWLQLANMYGEIGKEKEQLAIMETAFQRGFVEKRGDLMALSQLYVYNQIPYKGAKLMEKAIETGTVEKNSRNLKFVAQSLTMAREDESAIPVLEAAAALSEDGNLDAEMAQTLLNLQKYEQAITAANKAFEKGQLDRPGIAHLILGMSYFNLKQYDSALKAFESAIDFKGSRKMANQWLKYVKTEKRNAEALARTS